MDAGSTLRAARIRAGLTQVGLAERAGTSQATISAYESGAKRPFLTTFSRLLAATGARLTVEPGRAPVLRPTPAQLAHAGRTLPAVLELAEALPVRHDSALRYPRLSARRTGSA